MKKMFLILMAFVGLAACISCSDYDCGCEGCGKSDYKAIKAHGTMKLIDNSYRHEVWRDTETGCEYFVRNTSQGVAVIQLTDKEGKPKISEE